MLVLTRKVGEQVIIGGNIHVTVVAVQGAKVRLGISAPPEVVVDRQEVHEKRQDGSAGRALPGLLPVG
jgi:carbon storage regulator